MDLKLIRNLVRIMERGEVRELELEDEKAGFRIHLKRGDHAPAAPGHSVVMVPGTGAPMAQTPSWHGDDGDDDDAPAERASLEGVEEITSPMVGTFYRAPSPGADDFTAVGERVQDDTVVCIIEAMKVMNEIKAELAGEILEILVENGDPVEFGQPLFLVKTT